MRTQTGLAVLAGLALVSVAGTASALDIRSPREGATVREKVRIVVPRLNLPPNGFVGLYIDNEFVVAQAPKTGNKDPIVFVWDTKQPRGKAGLTAEKRNFDDGEHVIEVRTYNQEGNMVERGQISVLLNNRVPVTPKQPVRLAYKFRPGDKTVYELKTEIEATNATPGGAVGGYPTMPYGGAGGPGAYPGIPGGQSSAGAGPPGGPEAFGGGPAGGAYPGAGGAAFDPNGAGGTQKYLEYRKVAVYVADNNTPLSLLREYPENPITTIINATKQPNYPQAWSHYYFLGPRGDEVRTNAMERLNIKPVYDVIRLPAHSVRVGEEWPARLNISLGAFIPDRIEVTATNVVEAIEWELGSPAARIRSTYKWSGKLSIPTLGITEANCKFDGTSVIHFAPGTGKPMRAVHTLDGDVIIDAARQGAVGSSGAMAGPGGPGAFPGAPGGFPGGPEGPGGPGGYSGGYPGGAGGTGTISLTPQTTTFKTKIRATMTAQR